MIGLSALFATAVLWDAYAIKRKRETISSACRRTQATPLGRGLFLAFWASLSWHLVRRTA